VLGIFRCRLGPAAHSGDPSGKRALLDWPSAR